MAARKLSRGRAATTQSVDDTRSRILASELFDATAALMTDARSISVGIFGRKEAERLLMDHKRKKNRLAVLGILLTAEQWRLLGDQLAHEARP